MSDGTLPGILGSLEPILNQYGYLAVAAFVTLEDFGVPVPGETILIAASVYAGAGRLGIGVVVVIAILAAIVGDNIGYAIGRYGGRRLIERWGRYVFITPERLDKAEGFFSRHGGKVVTIARFIEGLRQANGLIAGATEMRWRTFVLFNALGATLWVGVWASVGYLAGNHIGTIYAKVHDYTLYLGIAAAVVVVALVARHLVRSRRSDSAT